MNSIPSLKKGTEIELTITDAAYEGKGIGRIENIPIFVKNSAPGDVIRAVIIKKKKTYRVARLLEIIEPGKVRIEPACSHASYCGGCSWQHVCYEDQLRFKTTHVYDHLTRIGKLKDITVEKAIGSENEFYYRNKMEYSFSDKRWLTPEEIDSDLDLKDKNFAAGMHVPGRYDKVLNLNECHLQAEPSYQILDAVRQFALEHNITPYNTVKHKGFLRNLMIRNAYYTDDLMVNFVTNGDEESVMISLTSYLLDKFPQITTIVQNINDTRSPVSVGRIEKTLFGSGYIEDRIDRFSFIIHANTFFQTNTKQAERLYSTARDLADIQPGERVYDLYCGVGTLTLFMSDKASSVVGIELHPDSIENAIKNASDNNVTNCDFVTGDMKDTFSEYIISQYGKPDLIITDPPRAGMHPDVIQQLIELKTPKIVYVSCNSTTMARDLEVLNDFYSIDKVQPIDMFPQTYHIETAARLTLRKL